MSRRMKRAHLVGTVAPRPVALEEAGPCLVCGAPLPYRRDSDCEDGFVHIKADCQCGFGFDSRWPADAIEELRRLATRDRAES